MILQYINQGDPVHVVTYAYEVTDVYNAAVVTDADRNIFFYLCIQIYTILHYNVEVGDKVYAVGDVANTNTVYDRYEDCTVGVVV